MKWNLWRDVPTCSTYDIPGIEEWLSQQAARGRELTDWCTFRDAPPQTCQFALEPAEKGQYKPTEEQQESYGEAGWEFVCSSSLFLVWRSARPDALPLRTDPTADSWAYGRLWKRVQNSTLWAILALLGVNIFCLRQGGNSLLLSIIRSGATWKLLLLLVMDIVTVLYLLRDLRGFRQLLDSLRCGFPMPSRRLRPLRRVALFCIPLAMALLNLFDLATALTASGGVPLAEDPVPYLAAETLGGRGGSVTVERREDLLGESVTVCQGKPDVLWKRAPQPSNIPGSDILRIVYDTEQETVTLRVPALVGPLLREFSARIGEEAGEPPQPLGEHVYYLLDENGIQHLLLWEGGQVLRIRTNAPADLRDHLDDLTALLADGEGTL